MHKIIDTPVDNTVLDKDRLIPLHPLCLLVVERGISFAGDFAALKFCSGRGKAPGRDLI